jgi:hypothetical protein
MRLVTLMKCHWLVGVAALIITAAAPIACTTSDCNLRHLRRASSPPILFPKLRCLLALRRSGFALDKFDDYPTFFRNDSIVHLAQAGVYQGVTAIKEYDKFAYNGYSPYLLNVSNPTSGRNLKIKALGYRNGQCEFLTIFKRKAILNPSTTSNIPIFNFASMVKIFFDYELRYVSRINVYFTPDFLRVFFNVGLNSQNTRRFICNEVMTGPCGQMLNQTTEASEKCEAALQALPAVEGNMSYFDGNSFGCRALHASFALSNPLHCPHLSFAPLADNLGRIKCQDSKLVSPLDLFSESDLQTYRTFVQSRGINPILGHDSNL